MVLAAKVRLREDDTGRTSVLTLYDVEGIEVGDVHMVEDIPGRPKRRWTVEHIFKELVVTRVHRRE